MSYNNGFKVLFACRLCAHSFEQVSHFLGHIKENHLQEYERTTCIVFEDKPFPNSSYEFSAEVEGSSPSSVSFKFETFDDESSNLEAEPEPEPQSEGCITTHPLFEVIPTKIETTEEETSFAHEIQPQEYMNPVVLLKRISSKKILNFSENHSCKDSNVHGHVKIKLSKITNLSRNISNQRITQAHRQLFFVPDQEQNKMSIDFQELPRESVDEQAGVIVHELSDLIQIVGSDHNQNEVTGDMIQEEDETTDVADMALSCVFHSDETEFVVYQNESVTQKDVAASQILLTTAATADKDNDARKLRKRKAVSKPYSDGSEFSTLLEAVKQKNCKKVKDADIFLKGPQSKPRPSKLLKQQKKPLKMTGKIRCSKEGCSSTFPNRWHLNRHLDGKHGDKIVVTCETCQKTVKQTLYQNHLKKHEKKKCVQCGAEFNYFKNLNDHMITAHSNEKKFTCIPCGTKFFTRKTLVSHGRKHNNKLVKCRHCAKTFTWPAARTLHENKDHPHFECMNCDKQFGSITALNFHISSCDVIDKKGV